MSTFQICITEGITKNIAPSEARRRRKHKKGQNWGRVAQAHGALGFSAPCQTVTTVSSLGYRNVPQTRCKMVDCGFRLREGAHERTRALPYLGSTAEENRQEIRGLSVRVRLAPRSQSFTYVLRVPCPTSSFSSMEQVPDAHSSTSYHRCHPLW